MVSRIVVIAIDANEPRPVAEFWTEVLGWQIVEEEAGGITIAPEGAAWPTIDVLKVPERKEIKNRLHLELRADGTTAEAEGERLVAMGARAVDGLAPDITDRAY
ncbi:VOC family protein [Micromonospora coerulea]|uniref:VOC family protein n=1 Tax=Micromonospora coerulea TaxID=47856 RepID=UPI001905F573|nr:VOC family protein [Micromonospora veneta]